jgi:hypothetical protein
VASENFVSLRCAVQEELSLGHLPERPCRKANDFSVHAIGLLNGGENALLSYQKKVTKQDLTDA